MDSGYIVGKVSPPRCAQGQACRSDLNEALPSVVGIITADEIDRHLGASVSPHGGQGIPRLQPRHRCSGPALRVFNPSKAACQHALRVQCVQTGLQELKPIRFTLQGPCAGMCEADAPLLQTGGGLPQLVEHTLSEARLQCCDSRLLQPKSLTRLLKS